VVKFVLKKFPEGPLQAAPLGISNGYISSGQITASSNHDADHDTRGVRLLRSVHPIGSWSARHNDNQQWVQIDLLQITTVTGVATQGRNGVDQWVTTYKIEYSTNGVTWSVYKEDGKDKVFFCPSIYIHTARHISIRQSNHAISIHLLLTAVYPISLTSESYIILLKILAVVGD
jgi:hypothetical protein